MATSLYQLLRLKPLDSFLTPPSFSPPTCNPQGNLSAILSKYTPNRTTFDHLHGLHPGASAQHLYLDDCSGFLTCLSASIGLLQTVHSAARGVLSKQRSENATSWLHALLQGPHRRVGPRPGKPCAICSPRPSLPTSLTSPPTRLLAHSVQPPWLSLLRAGLGPCFGLWVAAVVIQSS